MPTPRAFAGWRSLSRCGPISDVPCRSIGTRVSIPCSTRELSIVSSHFRARRRALSIATAHLIVCVVIHLREPERGFRNPYLGDLAPSLGTPVVVSRCHCFVHSVDLSPKLFSQPQRVSRALPAMEWIPMHGCDPAYRFRVPPRHPAIAPRCRVNGRGVRNGETARAPRFQRPILSFDQSGTVDS